MDIFTQKIYGGLEMMQTITLMEPIFFPQYLTEGKKGKKKEVEPCTSRHKNDFHHISTERFTKTHLHEEQSRCTFW
jgi:hypothetical protein